MKKNIVLSCVEVTSGSRFGDTNWMFVALSRLDLGISAEGSPQYWAAQAMIGRRPPFKSVASEGCCFLSVTSRFVAANDSLLREDCAGLVACMAAHDTHGINEKILRHDCGRIIGLWRRFVMAAMPNITGNLRSRRRLLRLQHKFRLPSERPADATPAA